MIPLFALEEVFVLHQIHVHHAMLDGEDLIVIYHYVMDFYPTIQMYVLVMEFAFYLMLVLAKLDGLELLANM
jgi:hypothetical protein